jgi:hypothetical protein
MSRHSKNRNIVDAPSLARWIVVAAFFALTALSYLYLKLQLYHLGERRKALEMELANLRTQTDLASGQIAALTSRSALQRRLKEHYLKMVPIPESNIVRLPASVPRVADAGQTISNRGAGR